MHIVFSVALKPPRRFAFGLELRPLTLGHMLLLRELHCPIAQRGFEMGLGHYLLASFVCATDHVNARRTLFATSRVGRWRLNRFLRRWGRTVGKMDLVKEAESFLRYRNESLAGPGVKNTSGDLPKSPEEYRTLAMLMSDFHMARQEALDTEIALATVLWAAQGERLGKLELVDGSNYERVKAAMEAAERTAKN